MVVSGGNQLGAIAAERECEGHDPSLVWDTWRRYCVLADAERRQRQSLR
jgi:hypothetical protein